MDYSFEPMEPEQNGPERAPEPQKPKKKKHTALKVAALALVCALVGGVGGGAIMYGVIAADRPAAPAMSEEPAPAEDENVVVNSVVHTNTGDKSLTPQEVYNLYVDAVAGITTSGTTTNVFGQQTQFAASGSGFVISEDGYVVTNYHVIEDAASIKVSLYDGASYDAELVGSDTSNDVALLKVDATGLKAVAIGDSDQVAVGDQVAAIGNPLGQLTFSLTVGYISALDRAINTDGSPINMLQTDAAINSGNSGGPLFDMNGNVIGITTAKYSGSTSGGTSIEGIGFAIPINDVMSIVNDLKTYGYVTGQAYLGVMVKDLDATTAQYYSLPLGVYVDSITEGSCAEKAGVQKGDIITGIGDKTVESYSELAAALKSLRASQTVDLKVFRAGQELTLTVTLDEKQPEKPAAETPAEPSEDQQSGQSQNGQRGDAYRFDPFEWFFSN